MKYHACPAPFYTVLFDSPAFVSYFSRDLSISFYYSSCASPVSFCYSSCASPASFCYSFFDSSFS